MIVYGIDSAMRSIAVVGERQLMKIEATGASRHDELASMRNSLAIFLRSDQTPILFIESPIQGISRNVQVGLKLAMTVGAVFSLGHYTEMVEPSLWKKEVCGKGNLDKAGVAEWLKEAHPGYYARCDGDQDLIDATCIWLYGRQKVDEHRSSTSRRSSK